MKLNLTATAGMAAVAALAAFALASHGAKAQSPNAARIEQGVGCFMNLPSVVDTTLTTDKTIDVSTKGGTTQLTCHFDIPAGHAPNKATHAQGFTCNVITKNGTQLTTNSRASATPGGKALLSCQIKK